MRRGIASIVCVRPSATTSSNRTARSRSASASRATPGKNVSASAARAATCTDVGITSFEDWPMFTWSFGWTRRSGVDARRAITSFTFMLEDVPEPVWKTSIGKCSVCFPAAIASAAARIASARSASSRPIARFVVAHAAFTRAIARITSAGIGRPEIGKFSTARCVCAP